MNDEELTRFLAEKVMGWTVVGVTCFDSQARTKIMNFLGRDGWSPLTSIEDAMMLLDSLPGAYVELERHSAWNGWLCVIGNKDATADTAPRAICLAAKKVVESIDGRG